MHTHSMPNRSSKKQPRDVNQLTASIVDEAMDERQPDATPEPQSEERGKNLADVELGRLGVLKGGDVSAAKLASEQRSTIADQRRENREG